jgi:hypothetical protein
LAYTGTEVEEKRYNFIGAEWDRSEWLNEKFSHGLDFPNVTTHNFPYRLLCAINAASAIIFWKFPFLFISFLTTSTGMSNCLKRSLF